MNKEAKDILNQRRKLLVLEYAKAIGNEAEACRAGINYIWKLSL